MILHLFQGMNTVLILLVEKAKKAFSQTLKTLYFNGTPDRIRTCGLRIRRARPEK